LGDEKIYNLFSTALGANADFSLIAINKTFYEMQQALTSLNMGFNMKNTQNREVPNYFLMLHFSKPLYTQYPSNRDFASLDKYSVLLCGTIFDKSGRVIFSKCIDEEITDTVVSGIKFDDSARYEILLKNALNKLALSFANEVKFKNFQLDICATEGEYIYLNDANGFLKENNTLTIFKKVSTEKGGQEITIPTWEYKVLQVKNGKVECKPMFPIVDGLNFPSKKDKALITTTTKSCNKAEMFNFYPDKMALDGNQIELKDFQNIAFSAISSGMKSPVVFDKVTFSEQIKDLNAGYGFRQKLESPDNTQKLKIRPVYKVELLEEKKDGSLLKQKYQITVGMVSYSNDTALLKDGLKQEVSITVPPSDNSDIVQYELLKFIYPLLQQIAVKF
jgi:hypothetical protein